MVAQEYSPMQLIMILSVSRMLVYRQVVVKRFTEHGRHYDKWRDRYCSQAMQDAQ